MNSLNFKYLINEFDNLFILYLVIPFTTNTNAN